MKVDFPLTCCRQYTTRKRRPLRDRCIDLPYLSSALVVVIPAEASLPSHIHVLRSTTARWFHGMGFPLFGTRHNTVAIVTYVLGPCVTPCDLNAMRSDTCFIFSAVAALSLPLGCFNCIAKQTLLGHLYNFICSLHLCTTGRIR